MVYPIPMALDREDALVFVHGFLGFTAMVLPGYSLYYFRHARNSLAGISSAAHFPPVPPAGRIADRARVLGNFLETLPAQNIHLIGHSMGGLDSRYVASLLDSGSRVRTVISVGTPHRGTAVASWFIETRGPVQWAGRGLFAAALRELTPQACESFNALVQDRPDVHYFSLAGVRPVAEMPPVLRYWGRLLQRGSGDNDGLVPAESTRWGAEAGVFRSDHMELIGWSLARADKVRKRPFDDRQLYCRILELLSDRRLQV